MSRLAQMIEDDPDQRRPRADAFLLEPPDVTAAQGTPERRPGQP